MDELKINELKINELNKPFVFVRRMTKHWVRTHKRLKAKKVSKEPMDKHEQKELNRLNRWRKDLRNCRRNSRLSV